MFLAITCRLIRGAARVQLWSSRATWWQDRLGCGPELSPQHPPLLEDVTHQCERA